MDEVFQTAAMVLHGSTKEFKNVYSVLSVLDHTCYSQDQLKFLYMRLANEAFQFASETGSEAIGIWLFNCTPKIFCNLQNVNDQVVVLLFCGITYYNIARDMRCRYGRSLSLRESWGPYISEHRKQVAVFL